MTAHSSYFATAYKFNSRYRNKPITDKKNKQIQAVALILKNITKENLMTGSIKLAMKICTEVFQCGFLSQ